jgi:CYTH domain
MKRSFALIAAIFMFPGPAAQAQEKCPVEVKFLLSSATDTAIASLGFKKETSGRVYFFDTDSLDLLKQGAIVRVRQGANNDLTVKVRRPQGDRGVEDSGLRGRFPCEIDRIRAGAMISYAERRQYKTNNLPLSGSDIHDLLSPSQNELLHDSQVSVDWTQVKRIADISLTKWETPAEAVSGKLALELWEWPAGRLLEVSAKASHAAAASKYAELEQLLRAKDLSLSANQDVKTSVVLQTLAHPTSPPSNSR